MVVVSIRLDMCLHYQALSRPALMFVKLQREEIFRDFYRHTGNITRKF